MRSRFLSLFVIAGTVSAISCAPASREAEGEIANQVRSAIAEGTKTFDHARWNDLLQDVTIEGRVDYPAVASRRSELDAYVSEVAAVELFTLSGPELEALLINAYNAYTVLSILDHPGVGSIREIPGVWDTIPHDVGGFPITLDTIEHNLLRPFFRDPRIHFVANCASASCAPLPPFAYRGDDLENQLEEAARRFIRSPANVRLEGSTLNLSRYFDWYRADFTAAGWSPHAASVIDFVGLYATDEVRLAIAGGKVVRTRFIDYDWSLNQSPL